MMSKKVLIVTDNPSLKNSLSFEFESRGSLVQVCDMQTARQEALHWQPQAIIIDGELPGKDSLKVCRSLKDTSQLCSTPAIILAASMQPRQMSAAYKAGADFYVLNQGEDRRALLMTLQAIFNMHSRQMSAA